MPNPSAGRCSTTSPRRKTRGSRPKVLDPLPEIPLLPHGATLAGADDLVEIELWGKQQLAFPCRFRPYGHGVPSRDTSGAVLSVRDPKLFKACFSTWVEGLRVAGPDLVVLYGKTSRRRTRSGGRESLHLLAAWTTRQRPAPVSRSGGTAGDGAGACCAGWCSGRKP